MENKKAQSIIVIAVGGMAVLALFCYFFYNPTNYAWFPQCYFFQWTGWLCPSCGSQRALHALLHGEFAKAIAYNPFLVISIPYALLLVYTSRGNRQKVTILRRCLRHRIVVNIYLFLFMFWWIYRNI